MNLVCLLRAGQVVRERDTNPGNKNNVYSEVMKLKVVHLLAFFALTYIGVEVTIGGLHSSLVKCIKII